MQRRRTNGRVRARFFHGALTSVSGRSCRPLTHFDSGAPLSRFCALAALTCARGTRAFAESPRRTEPEADHVPRVPHPGLTNNGTNLIVYGNQ